MLRLLVLLCLSLYGAMVVYGNGPSRLSPTIEPARVAVAGAGQSGIRILPAPAGAAPSAPAPAQTEPAQTEPALPAEMHAVALVSAASQEVADLPAAVLPAAVLPANVRPGRIGPKTANVRAAPGKGATVAGKLAAGSAVQVLWAEPNGWIRVTSADGTVAGWVHESLLVVAAAPNDAAPVTGID